MANSKTRNRTRKENLGLRIDKILLSGTNTELRECCVALRTALDAAREMAAIFLNCQWESDQDAIADLREMGGLPWSAEAARWADALEALKEVTP